MRRPLLALACVATTYAVLAFLFLPRDAFFSSDEGLKLIQVQNLMRKGWSDFTLDYPGHGLDPDLSYVPINNPPPLILQGSLYAAYPVFFPLLVTPLYSSVGYAGLYVIPLCSGLLTVLFTFWLARLANGDGVPSLLIIGLCTPVMFYSLLFWDHTLGTALCTLALLLVARNLRAARPLSLVVAGLLLGLSIWARTELYVMAIVMLVAFFLASSRDRSGTLGLGAGILLALAPLWIFQWRVYGSALGPHVSHFASLGTALPVTTNRLAILYYTLLDAHSNPVLTFLFIMAFVATTVVLRSRRLHRNAVLLGTATGLLVLTALLNLSDAWSGRPIGGLLATAPLLAFSFAALSLRRAESIDRLLMSVFAGYVLLVCVATPVDPGLQWGPRFLLPAMPAGVVLATGYYRRLTSGHTRSSPRGAITLSLAALVGISLAAQICGLRVMNVIKLRDRQLIVDTAMLDCEYVMSDEYGYAQYVAPLFYEKQFFYVRTQEDYQRLTETFVRNGIRTYAVTTYPTPHRRVIDPLDVSEQFVVREVDYQLFHIEEADHAG
jgi:hypothetical protein